MPHLTDKQIGLIQQNWQQVRENETAVVKAMYDQLEKQNIPQCDRERQGNTFSLHHVIIPKVIVFVSCLTRL